MNNKPFIKGLLIGFLPPIFFVLAFSLILAGGSLSNGLALLISREQLENTIRIGVLTNCAMFTIIINKGNDKIAQGILVATLLTLIYTLI